MTFKFESAFPFSIEMQNGDGSTATLYNHGMTLRDYFAAKMLQGMVASPELLKVVTAAEVLGDEYSQRCATIAYKWADAMLGARK